MRRNTCPTTNCACETRFRSKRKCRWCCERKCSKWCCPRTRLAAPDASQSADAATTRYGRGRCRSGGDRCPYCPDYDSVWECKKRCKSCPLA